MKKPLMERINNVETIYEMKEKQAEMNMLINEIKWSISILKQDIGISQETLEIGKFDQIEKEITMFYTEMQNIEEKMQRWTAPINEEPTREESSAQNIYDNAIIHQRNYELQENSQRTDLQKEQVRVMNANISKFLLVYREKDKAIEEKNKSIYILQKKLNEAEQRIKRFIIEHENNKDKDNLIEAKTKIIATLQERLQEVENKFRKIALLHKNITEKETIKDTMIEEKNKFILSLQDKLNEIERKLQNMTNINENNKEIILNKKLSDIDQKIQSEKKKTWVFVLLFILFLLVSAWGFIFIYTSYIQHTAVYTI